MKKNSQISYLFKYNISKSLIILGCDENKPCKFTDLLIGKGKEYTDHYKKNAHVRLKSLLWSLL